MNKIEKRKRLQNWLKRSRLVVYKTYLCPKSLEDKNKQKGDLR